MRPKVEADSSVVESNNWQVGDLGAIWFSSPVAKERSNTEEATRVKHPREDITIEF